MVKGETLEKTSELVFAANQTPIKILGEIEIPLGVRSFIFLVRALVSEHVSEGMLGIDWLRRHECEWSFKTDELKIKGKKFTYFSTVSAGAGATPVSSATPDASAAPSATPSATAPKK